MNRHEFREQLEYALAELHDTVRLCSLPLAGILVPKAPADDRGWQLSRYLLESIARLRPVDSERDSWPWRRYELLRLRYVNALAPERVAERLHISRRHFYRQLGQALDEFADFVWARARHSASEVLEAAMPSEVTVDLLRQESERLRAQARPVSLEEIVDRALSVLKPVLSARDVQVEVVLPEALPQVMVSLELARQLLLGVLGEIVSWPEAASIRLRGRKNAHGVSLQIEVGTRRVGGSASTRDLAPLHEQLSTLAPLIGVAYELSCSAKGTVVCLLQFPLLERKAVLIVDDNEDVCQLLRRYLGSGGYDVLVAQSAGEAIDLARIHRPFAVTLDLMMNEQDGWDVLQILRHDPQTAHIPIIVCSVLDNRELAFMLGAAAYLKKPVMCDQLLHALESLQAR